MAREDGVMPREELQLEARRFTTVSALAREIVALLECSNYKLEIIIPHGIREKLDSELDGVKTLGRVKVRQV